MTSFEHHGVGSSTLVICLEHSFPQPVLPLGLGGWAFELALHRVWFQNALGAQGSRGLQSSQHIPLECVLSEVHLR